MREKLEGKVLYVTCEVFQAHSRKVRREVNERKTLQEEADTRLLYAKQAAADYDSIIIFADDTDVLIISMAVKARIDRNLYVKYDTRVWTTILCQENVCSS